MVKIVERCNLNCSYCYMYNHVDQSYLRRPYFMSEGIFDSLLTRIEEYCRSRPDLRMELTLHGGEPMLMRPWRLDRMVAKLERRLGDRVSLGLQTNGTLVSDEWADLLKRRRIRVGVSIDGPPQVHDSARVDHRGRGSHARVAEGLERLRKAGVFSGTITVVNPGQSGLETYRHLRGLNVRNMDFLVPEVTHDSKAGFYGDIGPTPVADYLISVFDAWFEEDDPTVKIRLFVDIIRKILGAAPSSEAVGNSPENYLVIDTDGSILGNDALKVCQEGLSETGLNVLENGFDKLHLGSPLLKRLIDQGMPLCKQCLACPECEVCAGGSLPTRYAGANGFDNPSVWCEDYLKLIHHIRSKIGYEIAA